jgi:hypothetical protein
MEWWKGGENCITRSFIICTLREVGGTCGTNGGEEEREWVIGRKAGGKRPLGRPRRRWIDNIKMDLLEIGLSVVDWIGLAQDR